MKNANSTRTLQNLWENGIQRAVEEILSRDELGDARVSQAAGLSLKTGVQAGGAWGLSDTCSQGQNCSIACVG